MITEKDARDLLIKACDDAGSVDAWAKTNGYYATYVSMMRVGKKPIGKRAAQALGLTKKICYIACNPQKGSA